MAIYLLCGVPEDSGGARGRRGGGGYERAAGSDGDEAESGELGRSA